MREFEHAVTARPVSQLCILPKSKGLKRTDRIVSIDMSGPETAFVKLECSVHPRYFTDYLSLLKLNGGWRIVSKTFRTDVRE